MARCQNPAPKLDCKETDEESNSEYDQQSNTERTVDVGFRPKQADSHLVRNYGAHMCSRIGPNDKFIHSETESSIRQDLSRQTRPDFSALQETVMQIRQTDTASPN